MPTAKAALVTQHKVISRLEFYLYAILREGNLFRRNNVSFLKTILEGAGARLDEKGPSEKISKASDFFLAVLIMAILAMIVLPISPYVIDYFIALNLVVSAILLLIMLYFPSSIRLSIFPSLLLISILYRLGVNIATTRQILLYAYGGDTVQQIGEFVVGGNFVVGGVVFFMIILTNFLVINMGVKQIVTHFTDKQKEGQPYGPMNGVMRSIEGDARANIVIILINILGGILIGMTMHRMEAEEAALTYGLLAMGNGLVSQIPALLITAGLVVSSENFKETPILPKALMVGAGLMMLMAALPGFPKGPFLILACIMGLIAYTLSRFYGKKDAVGSAYTR